MNATKRKKQAVLYPFLAFRPSRPLEKRLRRVAKATNRSLSATISLCLASELPRMEAAAEREANFKEA